VRKRREKKRPLLHTTFYLLLLSFGIGGEGKGPREKEGKELAPPLPPSTVSVEVASSTRGCREEKKGGEKTLSGKKKKGKDRWTR